MEYVKKIWSPQQCADMIAKAHEIGFSRSTIDTGSGTRVVESVRNNTRVFYKSFELAEELWQSLKPYLPGKLGNSEPYGMNELFRIYQYTPGQQFKLHRDSSYVKSNNEASYYTVLIYLNDDFVGGETTLHKKMVVTPETGAALIFLHEMPHTGEMVKEGTKYVLRTDVMYRLEE